RAGRGRGGPWDRPWPPPRTPSRRRPRRRPGTASGRAPAAPPPPPPAPAPGSTRSTSCPLLVRQRPLQGQGDLLEPPGFEDLLVGGLVPHVEDVGHPVRLHPHLRALDVEAVLVQGAGDVVEDAGAVLGE